MPGEVQEVNSKNVLILDGGMGHLLKRKGVPVTGLVGSLERFLGVALANRNNPRLVEECHLEYLRAGAQIITTNSYACVPAALTELGGVKDTEWASYAAAAGEVAQRAVATFMSEREASPPAARPMVAGCVPPLSPTYRAECIGTEEDMRVVYTQVVAAIAPYSDILLCETLSTVSEARAAALAAAASAPAKPVWVSWTLQEDGRLRSGETVEEAAAALTTIPQVKALLFNCCSHESICAALPRLAVAVPTGVRVGAYANGFQMTSADQGWEAIDDTPGDYRGKAEAWVALGATVVGGCCGVYPEHVACLSAPLQQCKQASVANPFCTFGLA